MTPLAEALTAAQRRALGALEKAYVAGQIEAETLTASLEAAGITDPIDLAFLLSALDVLREWGVAAPNLTERVADAERKATDAQGKYAQDLLQRGGRSALAEDDLRALTSERISDLIDSLKAGSYDPSAWDVPF